MCSFLFPFHFLHPCEISAILILRHLSQLQRQKVPLNTSTCAIFQYNEQNFNYRKLRRVPCLYCGIDYTIFNEIKVHSTALLNTVYKAFKFSSTAMSFLHGCHIQKMKTPTNIFRMAVPIPLTPHSLLAHKDSLHRSAWKS